MSAVPIIEVSELSKRYRLGSFGAKSLRDEAEILWQRLRGLVVSDNVGATAPPVGISTAEFWALKNVSFQVEAGTVLGIVGRNGAGKSTLLKLLSRITEPTEGEIIMRGRVASLLEVGTGFHPELSGRENIFLNGAILGMSKAEICAKFDRIVDFSEIGKFIDTPVKRYSSGMYVRLAFAVAAHLEPDILIIDEVLAVGDAEFQSKCLGKMEEVAGRGRTVLFVSHNMGAVSALTTNAICLAGGEVVMTGASKKVVSWYLSDAFAAEAVWVAPTVTSHPLQITNLKLMEQMGRLTSEFEIGEIIVVELDIDVRSRVRNVVVELWIFAPDGQLLMVTGEYESHPEILVEREVGRYRSRVELPSDLFNTGSYFIKINSCWNGTEVFDHCETVQFEVVENRGVREWNKRLGYFSPKAKWTVSSAGNVGGGASQAVNSL